MQHNFIIVNVQGKDYKLSKDMYGTLSSNRDSPLSCVCESNNSLSIDFWKGCAYQCSYCHVQGTYEDLDENYKMLKKPVPRSMFTVKEIVDELIKHKFFKKDYTLISIATSSTEPFANVETTKNTLQIMEYFVELNLKNPFWIVTKAGIPKGIEDRLYKIADNGNKIMISICYSNNPKLIEPVQNNRFKNLEKIKHEKICISWYFRPLVKEWNASKKQLEETIFKVSKDYGKYIDMIIPGGLRWTDGIEFGLVNKNIDMPKLEKEYDKKTLSNETKKNIIELLEKYMPEKPIYFNSSCAISHMLNRTNIAILNILKKETCRESKCFNPIKEKCKNYKINEKTLIKIKKLLQKNGLQVEFLKDKKTGEYMPCLENFNYTIRQEIKKEIAIIINESIE